MSSMANQEELDDTEGVIRTSKLKKHRQHNRKKKKGEQRSTKHLPVLDANILSSISVCNYEMLY